MPIDFNAGNTSEMQTSFGDNPIESGSPIKTTNPIQNNTGIQMMDPVGAMMNSNSPIEKPNLQAPELTATDLMEETITLSPEMRARLGINAESVPLADFMKTCLEKLAGAEASGKDLANLELNLDKMSGGDLELLCLLVCQKSKSQLVDILKNTLNAKTKERQALNDKYKDLQAKMADERIKAAEELKAAKARSIARAILGAVFAVVAAVVAVVATVATAGAAAPLVAFAIAGAVCACAGAALSVTSSGLTIAALTTESKEYAEKLNNANNIVGYIGLGVSLLGCVCSVGTGIVHAVKGITTALPKAVEAVSGVSQGIQGTVEGSFSIAEGVSMKRQAELEKEMANVKIAMAKNEQVVEFLTQFLKQLEDNIQTCFKNILECEQTAGSEINRMSDNLLSLADKVPAQA